MNFLEKLDYLMQQKGLNKSSLSKSCNIPYTTIDGWYKKGYEGLKLTTLKKLADFFGTSLDYWATEDEYQNKFSELAAATFQELQPEYQKYIIKQIEQLLEIQRKTSKPNTETAEKITPTTEEGEQAYIKTLRSAQNTTSSATNTINDADKRKKISD